MTNKEKVRNQRIGTIVENISGFKMKCIDYRNSMDIDIEFINNGYIVKNVQWNNFIRGKVRSNCPKVKNETHINKQEYGVDKKEYNTWHQMLRRCFNSQVKEEKPTYKDASCCDEWLSYDNFRNWLRSQENYDKWKDLKWSAIDKDIIYKGNKLYSPERCFLVPVNINNLLVKHDAMRGNYPIGVYFVNNKYIANCTNPIENKLVRIGLFNTEIEAFEAYKEYKENLIKEIADIEYDKGTITKKCRDALYAYKVEIND